MGWIIFVIAAWTVALLVVPLKHWKTSWPVGIYAMASIYMIDNVLVLLGAFRFWHGGVYIFGLPVYYWISYFPGGILFDYLRPYKHAMRLVYILIVAGLYMVVELVMIYFGFFQHLNWNPLRSYILNIMGFTTAMWFAEWIEQGWNK